MRWTAKDADVFLKQKKYIDTIIVPLVPVSVGTNIKLLASQGEFIQLLTNMLETQFRGRMFLLPPYTYLAQQDEQRKQLNLLDWEKEILESDAAHLFYLTSDHYWKTCEHMYKGDVFWLPSIPLEHMEENYKFSIMEDQVKQLINIIAKKWQRGV
ncbi:YpiF family protein [Heyndrickxia acidicola]|uniref:YpiF family protein n=1 Tax=Heyndrickxia acidicola TaxID=209389 RepID=A0ABU6MPN2_9BACI|nr:YpiF family protein [Heyndrickxia acidicola]MED1205005.1 YpiF family protein [Heyndrickxia acidicola]